MCRSSDDVKQLRDYVAETLGGEMSMDKLKHKSIPESRHSSAVKNYSSRWLSMPRDVIQRALGKTSGA
jgi:hypothetical protein